MEPVNPANPANPMPPGMQAPPAASQPHPQPQPPLQQPQPRPPAAAPSPYTVTFKTGQPYHVHKSYIFVGPVAAVLVVIAAIIINGSSGWVELYFALQRHEIELNLLMVLGICLVGLILVMGLFMALYGLAWKYMTYVFDEREFSFYSGIIVKKRVHVPYERVQSVNHRATLLQRLFGVCTVVIDSAGGSANKGVRVPYVRLATAERMRSDIFVRKAAAAAGMPVVYAAQYDSDAAPVPAGQAPVPPGAVPAAHVSATPAMPTMPPQAYPPNASFAPVGAPASDGAPNVLDDTLGAVGEWRGLYGGIGFAEEPVSFSYGLKNHELLFASLSHPGPLAGAIITGLCLLAVVAFGIFAADYVSLVLAALAAPIAIGAFLFVWIIGSVGIMLGYGGFRVRRRGTRIEVERGLITRNSSGIDVSRIQSIEVRQSILRRMLGYCELSLGRIDAASQNNSQSNNNSSTKGLVIHPFVKLSAVDGLLSGLLPEFDDRPRIAQEKKLPRVALRRSILRHCLWYNWVLWSVLALVVCWVAIFWGISASTPGFGEDLLVMDDVALRFLSGLFVLLVVICVVATAVFAVSAVLWARHSGYVWNRRFLLLHNDGLTTSTSIIPRQKLQCGLTRSNPFQRRLELTSIIAVTAAGTSSTSVRLLDVPAPEGDAYLQWLH